MSCSIVRLKQNDTRSNWFLKFILYKYTIAYVLRLRAVSICIMYIYIYIYIPSDVCVRSEGAAEKSIKSTPNANTVATETLYG